jgi:hypothetical protein
LGNRKGDGADMVFLELVDRPLEEKLTESKTEKKEKGEALSSASSEAQPGKKKKQSKEASETT